MRIAAVTMVAGMLAGCSPSNDTPAPDPSASPTPIAKSTAEGSQAPLTADAPRPGSALTGQVSALNSNVSGLNIRVTDMGTIIDLPSDALFDFDKAALTPGATEQLEKSAQIIREAPAGTIRIVGHTDSKGDDAYNQKLSQARARTVADWFLTQVGVRQRAFDVSGMGEKTPIVPDQTADGNDNPEGRARNRRVEVIVPNKP
jgi:outer membrane protein OmpA-like peptidoglycan-associated protein